jgi:two-component system sensor histidine kinase BaeS
MITLRWLNSLGMRLIVAFVGIALTVVALASFLVERSTSSEFETYLANRQMMERGQGVGRPSAGPGLGPLVGALENAFLDDVRSSLWVSGGISAGAALILAVLVAVQMTRPLRGLATAAGAVAEGRLDVRVPAQGSDEMRCLGQAFNAMAQSLELQEHQRRSLMTDIAHELRTPLSILQGNLEAMRDDILEPSQEQLAILHEETLALSRVIDDLRTLSLAEAGQLKLERRSTDIGQLVRRLAAEMEARARERDIRLQVQTPADIVPAMADADRIAQVIRNLLDNALHYTPTGGKVELVVTGGAGEAMLSVIDTGSGIAPEDLPHVFDRFYRADPSRSRVSGGSGLGLAIVRQLVEVHGGSVWAESEPGRGSAFHVSLPAADRQ